jgi:PAS domain S-box-containing protein
MTTPLPTTRSRVSILYASAIIILLALVGVSSYLASLNMDKESTAIVKDAIPFSDAAQNLLSDLVNQETGIRGYLISGDPAFLEPFEIGKDQLNRDLATVREYEAKYPSTQILIESRAAPQIQRIQAYFNSQIELVKSGSIEEARKRVDNGKQNMDQYRDIQKSIQDNIDAIIGSAYASSRRAGVWTRAITLGGGFLGLIIAALSFALSIRANRAEEALRKSEETYRSMAESLEAQNEEIIAQQEEQERTLLQLSEREQELETISSYQETLTGQVELSDFLRQSIPGLLDSLKVDAALVAARRKGSPDSYEIVYSCGFPDSHAGRYADELYGAARRVVEEKKPIARERRVSGKEAGLHEGVATAFDQYHPLMDEEGNVLGILLLTSYDSNGAHEAGGRLTRGLTRQFSLAFFSQWTNEERRRQAVHMEELNDQLLAEKQMIEEQRDVIARILESTHEGMMMCDAEGRVQFANQNMQRYFPQEGGLVGRSFVLCCRELEAGSSGYAVARKVAETLLAGEHRQFTERFTVQPEEGNVQHVELFATPVGDGTGTGQSGFLIVFRDRTEEERVDEMKTEFVSIVSHELRTPLASVLGFVEILLNRELPADKQRKYMETIYREATRLSNLINDFLDLQRMESGKQVYHFAPVEAAAIVREVAEQWQGKQNHHIRVHESDAELWVKADGDRLRQVLHNLLSNAIKYSPQADRVDVRVFRSGDTVVLEIQDYGLGIPAGAEENLFSKFYRVDNTDRRQIGGTGLGLAIVKEIIEAHQGAVSFESAMGEGSTFRIELERYRPQSLEQRIVVLEDDDNLAKLMQVALSKLGLPTVQLRSAEEAMLLLGRMERGAPLLFIVDIHLEGVKTGWDFLSYLYAASAFSRIPVVVSTALDQPADYHEKEVERYLKKPFTMERLLEVVTSLLAYGDKPVYVFPAQDESVISSSLQRSGIGFQDMTRKEDTIVVDIKPQGSSQ